MPDFIEERRRLIGPPQTRAARTPSPAIDPFIMQADGKGWIFVPTGLQDGPLPTHYEPQESVIKNPLYGQQCNPARMEWMREDNPYHQPYDDPRFPVCAHNVSPDRTSHRRRHVPLASWLSELQPEMFCEVSPELAAECGSD